MCVCPAFLFWLLLLSLCILERFHADLLGCYKKLSPLNRSLLSFCQKRQTMWCSEKYISKRYIHIVQALWNLKASMVAADFVLSLTCHKSLKVYNAGNKAILERGEGPHFSAFINTSLIMQLHTCTHACTHTHTHTRTHTHTCTHAHTHTHTHTHTGL